MYLFLCETTIKTILGIIVNYSIENFFLYTIFDLFTAHIYICYQFSLKIYLFRIFRFWP